MQAASLGVTDVFQLAEKLFAKAPKVLLVIGGRCRIASATNGTVGKWSVKYPVASCEALREGDPSYPKLRTEPLSSPHSGYGDII